MEKKNTAMIIPPRLMSGDGAADCLNMRRSNDTESYGKLTPVGIPQTVCQGDYIPFYSFRHSDGSETLMMHSGNILFAVRPGYYDEPRQLALLSSAPTTAVASGNRVYVMTTEGAYWLEYNDRTDEWTDLGLKPEFPAIRLFAAETAEFTASTAARRLTKGYTRWEGELSDVDAENLSADMKALYTDITAQAVRAGYYLQPVLARYQLFDRAGMMLYESASVMLAPPDGFQCVNSLTAEVTQDGGEFRSVGRFSLSATGYKIGVETSETVNSEWERIVATIKILITPQLHPVDYDAEACYRLESATATTAILRAFLPGTSIAMQSATDRRMDLAKSALADFDRQAKLLAQYNNPFDGGMNGTEIFSMIDRRGAKAACKRLASLLENELPLSSSDYEPTLLRSVSAPHSFTATAVSAAGDVIAWGGITPRRYGGYPATMMAAETTSGAWRANIQVTFKGNDEAVVWYGEGTGNAPLTFFPLLSYPHPDAEAMTITVTRGGETLIRTVRLEPLGNMAVYIDESFAPLALTDEAEAYVIPAEKRAPVTHGGTMLVSQLSSPLDIISVMAVAQGNIVAVTQAVRSASTWDFARTHLYAFTTTGVNAVAVNAKGQFSASRVIDPRGVLSAKAVSATPEGVYAVAGSELIKVAGSRAATVSSEPRFNKIGWCSRYGELWAVDAEGNATILTPDGYYRRDIAIGQLFASPSGRLFLQTEGAILDASREMTPDRMNVRWETRVQVDDIAVPAAMKRRRLPRVGVMSWLLYASDADIRLSVRGTQFIGRGESMPLLELAVSGSLNAPVPARVIAPPRYYIIIGVEGAVSADAVFDSMQLLWTK